MAPSFLSIITSFCINPQSFLLMTECHSHFYPYHNLSFQHNGPFCQCISTTVLSINASTPQSSLDSINWCIKCHSCYYQCHNAFFHSHSPQSFLSMPQFLREGTGCTEMDLAAATAAYFEYHSQNCRKLRNIAWHMCANFHDCFYNKLGKKRPNDSPVRISAIWVEVATAQRKQTTVGIHSCQTPHQAIVSVLLTFFCCFVVVFDISNAKHKFTQQKHMNLPGLHDFNMERNLVFPTPSQPWQLYQGKFEHRGRQQNVHPRSSPARPGRLSQQAATVTAF